MDIAELIEAVREKNNWNQTQLANAIGVSQRTISNYELGNSIPSKRIRRKLEKLAGIESMPENTSLLDTEHVAELKKRLQEAEKTAAIFQARYELFQHLFDQIMERSTFTFQGSIGAIKNGLGAMGKSVASGHT